MLSQNAARQHIYFEVNRLRQKTPDSVRIPADPH